MSAPFELVSRFPLLRGVLVRRVLLEVQSSGHFLRVHRHWKDRDVAWREYKNQKAKSVLLNGRRGRRRGVDTVNVRKSERGGGGGSRKGAEGGTTERLEAADDDDDLEDSCAGCTEGGDPQRLGSWCFVCKDSSGGCVPPLSFRLTPTQSSNYCARETTQKSPPPGLRDCDYDRPLRGSVNACMRMYSGKSRQPKCSVHFFEILDARRAHP
ncbi:hypothetical protein B0H14DRAFT_2626308 [Mycena olivaceomarginata]|nr:hypothetical protein B0H14DRAFT_2626308 [Mycena olivaceomarginata]